MSPHTTQQTCQALDEGAGIPQHACWPSESKATDVLPQGEQTTQSQAENPPLEGKAPSLQEELLYVLHYLRAQHCYCLYCGMQVCCLCMWVYRQCITKVHHDAQ